MSQSTAPKTVYLKDYQPPQYLIPEIKLHFDLFEDEAVVTAEMNFTRNPKSKGTESDLFLDGKNLQLLSIQRDGSDLSSDQYEVNPKGLLLKDCPEQFKLKTQVKLKPQENKAFSGLYKTKTVFCTQMEAVGFRRTTYFLDRPDVLSKYTTTIVADKEKYPVLLSNGNFIEQKDLENGRHQAIWEDPFPKPCYLFALVAGDLDWIEDSFMTRTKRKVDLKIYVDKGQKDRARFAMDSLKQSMKWDEDTYRLEYDLDIYNIVAVDDFNMGAMENKGLNIFNSKYVLASSETATDTDYQNIQRVIGHEYFHNWTGNRVTCRDWFQLSLKEGLTVFRDQEFSSDMNSRPVKRIEDVANLRSRQFPEDAGPMAHPVRPQSYIAIDNFYTVTVYEKGAEVIRMLHTLLGPDLFKKGVTKYFELYDGQAVTTDDWIHAMEVVSGRDFTQFKNWYDQAGTPQISVSTEYDKENKTYSVELQQSTLDPARKTENKPYHIPLKAGLVSKKGSAMEFTREGYDKKRTNVVLELNEAQQKFIFNDVYEEPVLSINREFSAPIKLNYEQPDQELYLLMTRDQDSFNRWESAQKLYRQTLVKFYHQICQGQTPELPSELPEAVLDLIERGQEAPALTARILEVPSVNYLAQFLKDIDPQHLHEAYKSFFTQMSGPITESAFKIYQQLEERKLGQSAQDVELRTFKNSLLGYLYRSDSSQAEQIFYRQFQNANNMTDSLAALARLSQGDYPLFEQAMGEFHQKWQNNFLVMINWLSMKAVAKGPQAFKNLKATAESDDFDITNPNNVYSLIYQFAQNNWPVFHQPDGQTYEWFVEKMLDVDSRNPQVAARLGNCFNNWQMFAAPIRKNIKPYLEKIVSSGPSDNLYEIVSRSLNQDR